MKKKILLLIPSLQLGGAERNIIWLGEALKLQGFDVKLCHYIKNGSRLSTNLEVLQLPTFKNTNKVVVFFTRVIQLKRLYKETKPDIIIAFLESISIPAVVAALLLGKNKNIIVSVRGNPQRYTLYYNVLAYCIFPFAKYVTIPSSAAANYMVSKFGLKNVISIPNPAPNLGRYSFEKHSRDKNITFIAIGRLIQSKRFDNTIEIISKLNIGNKKLKLIGNGPELKKLQQLALEKSVELEWIPYATHLDILQHIYNSQILISCSETECWPNVIVEAMSVGTPVIATNCNFGPNEIISDNENGYLFDINDIQSAVTKIKILLANEKIYNNFSNSALNSSLSYSSEKILDSWLVLIKKIKINKIKLV